MQNKKKKNQKRDISRIDFSKVADDSNININTENNKENDNEINWQETLDDILKPRESMDETHKFRGYYLENKVADTIDRITGSNPKKGMKSDLINHILKQYFKDKGWM